jgi:SAM-dependent methyltransferase
MDREAHWQKVYATKSDRDVSWFQESPAISLRLIEAAGLSLNTCVLDIGGGVSRLVDTLLAKGVGCVCVLDIAEESLTRTQARLGPDGGRVKWIVADVTGEWAVRPVDIWHDRAVFHFLTAASDRANYIAQLRRHLKPGGSAIIATFGPDGPEKCSGLPVVRYSADALAAELGHGFALVESVAELHQTPSGRTQAFQYARFVKTDRPNTQEDQKCCL